jgi:Tol biopolymer transport system component
MRPPFDSMRATEGRLAFSADGQLLVWMSWNQPGQTRRFYVVAPDAAPREVLSDFSNPATLPALGWLPDNQHLVLALPDARLGNRHLWMVDTKTSAARQVTSTHTNETDPVVSPDGRRIAYASDEVDFDLVLITPDGRERRSMLATARNEFSPAW